MTRPHPPNTFDVCLTLKQYISHFYFLVSIFNMLFKCICLIVKEIIKKNTLLEQFGNVKSMNMF